MAGYEPYSDNPGLIRLEGMTMSLVFTRNGDGTGTLEWNLPDSAGRCGGELAYDGIVITQSFEPSKVDQRPVDGTYYSGDPTVDDDLFAGDRINGVKVVGALYHDKTTTSLTVQDVANETPYYFTAYPVDKVGRYYQDGMNAYSLPFGGDGTDSTPGTHVIDVNADPSDPTGINPTEVVTIDMLINGEPYTLQIDGRLAQTYEELQEQIQKQLNQIEDGETVENLITNAGPPNANTLYFDGENVYLWTGDKYIPYETYVGPTNPLNPPDGTYWLDTTTGDLYVSSNQGQPTVWTPVDYLNHSVDPTRPECGAYWFDGTTTYKFNGTVWCPMDTTVQTSPPSESDIPCGAFWFDETPSEALPTGVNVSGGPDDDGTGGGGTGTPGSGSGGVLKKLCDEENGLWEETDEQPLYFPADPTNPPDGTFWFDETELKLYVRVSGTWVEQHVFLVSVEESKEQYEQDPLNNKEPEDQDYYFLDDILYTLNRTPDGQLCELIPVDASTVIIWPSDPTVTTGPDAGITACDYWWDSANNLLYQRNHTNTAWVQVSSFTVGTDDPTAGVQDLIPDESTWYKPAETISYNLGPTGGTTTSGGSIVPAGTIIKTTSDTGEDTYYEVTGPGTLVYDPVTDTLSGTADVSEIFIFGGPNGDTGTDPGQTAKIGDVIKTIADDGTVTYYEVLAPGTVVYDPATDTTAGTAELTPTTEVLPFEDQLYIWDGVNWDPVEYYDSPTNPSNVAPGTIWYDPDTGVFYERDAADNWVPQDPLPMLGPPPVSEPFYWFDTTTNTLNELDDSIPNFISPIPYSSEDLRPNIGDYWYDPLTGELYMWNGSGWEPGIPVVTADFDENGNLLFETAKTGSEASVEVNGNPDCSTLFAATNPAEFSVNEEPTPGTDGVDGTPNWQRLGVGTDGTQDERREILYSVKAQLGFPQVEVELTNYQMETALNSAIESYRKRSGWAYKQGYFCLTTEECKQKYILSNQTLGFDRIFDIMAIRRATGGFYGLGGSGGNGVFDMAFTQYLFHGNASGFDLTTYHLTREYLELLEHLFATRIVYEWCERTRELHILQNLRKGEKLLIECTTIKTEQELLTDRYALPWIEQYAKAEAKLMLAQIRGKYTTLPGANGGTQLNGAELQAQGEAEKEALYMQLDDHIVSGIEQYGAGGTILFG